jgi:hypothetical protein
MHESKNVFATIEKIYSWVLFIWVWRVDFLKTIIGCQLGDPYFLG